MSSHQRTEDRIVCAALAAGVFLCTNCSGDTVDGADDSSTSATTAAATTGEDETGEAPTGETPDTDELPAPPCAGDVYVGRRTNGGTCGDFLGAQGSWVGASLGTEGVLATFCEYRWTPDADAEPDLSALPGPTGDVASLAALCPRVIPQAGYFTGDDTLRGLIAAEFMANIGKPSSPMPADRAPVDVRLIDTMPDGLFEKGLMPRSHHGLILRRLAEDMLCTAGDCLANVGNHLGLPRLDEYEVDTERGGFFGNLVELAQGIDEGLEESEVESANSRRILVLALGWDGVEDYGSASVAGETVSDVVADPAVPADLQFVVATLARASCRGALTVAAAGNATAEPCTQTGPTGPGFLEALPAPDAAMCDALGFDHAGVNFGEGRPLVLAATHVTPAGEPAANARQGAQAALVAQGAMFGDPNGSDEMLRGSSVAATVIGVTAAWVWSYYPKLTPAQVRQALYTAGTPIPGEPAADFPGPAEARQTSICGALLAACELSGADCASLPACTPAPGADPAIAAHLQNKLDNPCQGDPGCTMPHTMTLGPDFPSNGQTPSACGGDITTWPASDLPPLAPLPPQPWTIPQPGSTMCPTCFVTVPPDGTGIKVGLDFIKDVELPEQMFIHVETSTGTYRIAIPVDQLMTDRANVVEILPPIEWGEVRRVELGYVFKGLGGGLHYRAEPLASFEDLCEDAPDECYMPGVNEAQRGVGACQPGTSLCTVDGWKCEGGGTPTPEDCSTPDIDEDCDGSTGCCGDGIVSDGEECDDGPLNGESACSEVCEEQRAYQVVTGYGHSCALLTGGAVKCWGDNQFGQLGYGDSQNRGGAPSEMGEHLPEVELGKDEPVVELSSGGSHTCALFSDGVMKCWGMGAVGELGSGNSENRGDSPSEIGIFIPAVDVGSNLTISGLGGGGHHTCAQIEGGRIKCWGSSAFGALGLGDGALGLDETMSRGDDDGEMGDALPFINVGDGAKVAMVSYARYHACVMLEGGEVKCWGLGSELGLGYDPYALGDNIYEMGDALPFVDLGSDLTAKSVSCGQFHTCALLINGQIKCWGRNAEAQLGIGSTYSMGAFPGQMGDDLPIVELGNELSAVDIQAGLYSSCALLDDGLVKCWGWNDKGELGLGHTAPIGDQPDEMGDALPVVSLGVSVSALGRGIGKQHHCALLSDGSVKCWGNNEHGQLGLGDTENRGDEPGEMGNALPRVKLFTSKW